MQNLIMTLVCEKKSHFFHRKSMKIVIITSTLGTEIPCLLPECGAEQASDTIKQYICNNMYICTYVHNNTYVTKRDFCSAKIVIGACTRRVIRQ
jgi:hypothetical protein